MKARIKDPPPGCGAWRVAGALYRRHSDPGSGRTSAWRNCAINLAIKRQRFGSPTGHWRPWIVLRAATLVPVRSARLDAPENSYLVQSLPTPVQPKPLFRRFTNPAFNFLVNLFQDRSNALFPRAVLRNLDRRRDDDAECGPTDPDYANAVYGTTEPYGEPRRGLVGQYGSPKEWDHHSTDDDPLVRCHAEAAAVPQNARCPGRRAETSSLYDRAILYA